MLKAYNYCSGGLNLVQINQREIGTSNSRNKSAIAFSSLFLCMNELIIKRSRASGSVTSSLNVHDYQSCVNFNQIGASSKCVMA